MAKPITTTFEKWCLENHREDLLGRWDYDKNDKIPSEVGFSSTYKAYFLCDCENCKHPSSNYRLNNWKNKNSFQCRYKNSFYQWCLDNNRNEYLDLWNYELNDISPMEVSAYSNKKYYFYCRKDKSHKSHCVTLNNITSKTDMNAFISCLECDNFKQWCIANNRLDLLSRWDYELNSFNPEDVFKNKNIKIWLKCPKGIHESEQFSLPNITSSRNIEEAGKCRKCNSFAQYLIDLYGENALEKYWDYDKNTYNPWHIDKSARKDIYIKCQEVDYHGTYKTDCVSFSSKGCRCSYCNDTRTVHKMDSVGWLYPQIKDYWDDNIEKLYSISLHSNLKYNFKCKKHGKFIRTMNDAVGANYICPKCSDEQTDSMLQIKVCKYLNETYNYAILHEQNCTCLPINPKTNYPLPFDNEVFELKLIIEVHGKQHYEMSGFHMLSAKHNNSTIEEEFAYQQWKDQYKKEYALNHGYFYLEIPYWSEENDLYIELIDNKIKELQLESQSQDSLLLCSNA